MLGNFTYETTRDSLRLSLSTEWISCIPGQLENIDTLLVKSPKKQIDDETGQLIDARYSYVAETRKQGTSRCLLPDSAFDHTRIVKLVRHFPIEEKALIFYLYAESFNWDHVVILSSYVWNALRKKIKKNLRKKKLKKLKSMVLLALQEYRSLVNSGKTIHPASKVMILLKLSNHHWSRDWLPYWRHLIDILKNLDEHALVLVYRSTSRKIAA